MANQVATDARTLPNFYEAEGRFSGVFSWIFSTDHKKIGLLYIAAMTVFFLMGMTFTVPIWLKK